MEERVTSGNIPYKGLLLTSYKIFISKSYTFRYASEKENTFMLAALNYCIKNFNILFS